MSTSSATPTPSPSGPPDPHDGIKSALDALSKAGFTCSDEGLKGYVSEYCTHYNDTPALDAYVGGNSDGTIGRLAIVHYGGESTTDGVGAALDLQARFISLAVPNPSDARRLEAAVRKGTDDNRKDGKVGSVTASGSNRGSLILVVGGWRPRAVVATLQPTSSIQALRAQYAAQGWACQASRTLTECLKTRKGTLAFETLDIATQGPRASWMSLTVEADDSSVDLFKADVGKLFTGFVQGPALADFVKRNTRDSNWASEFHDGMLYQFTSTKDAANLYVWPTCWAGTPGASC